MFDRIEKTKQNKRAIGSTFSKGKSMSSFFDRLEFQNHSMKRESPVQKADNKEKQNVDMNDLPEEQAKSYMMESFKKGKFSPPELDSKGDLIQLKPTKSYYDGGEMFVVSKSDLDTGTDTNSTTREYVNSKKTFKPTFVQFNYLTSSTKPKSIGTNYVYSADNPQPSMSYSSGSFYDAGHKLASQNGGLGNDPDWVFPQNPAFNQGNSRLMSKKEKLATGKTYPVWRQHEQGFHNAVKNDGYGVWWIELQ